MKKGDKILCKKTLRQFYKTDGISKFELFFIRLMGWDKKFYIRNKWYEIIDVYNIHYQKWVRIKTEENNVVVSQIFTINERVIDMYKLSDYFYYTEKDIRKLKLNEIEKRR